MIVKNISRFNKKKGPMDASIRRQSKYQLSENLNYLSRVKITVVVKMSLINHELFER